MKRQSKGRAGLRPAGLESGRSRSSLGVPTRTSDLIREVERGFPFRTLRTFTSASGMPVSRMARILGIPERTLARRRKSGRLAPEESERLLRVSRVFENAVALFEGNREAALSWLNTPRKVLGEQTPLEYSRTELGAREVENLIGQIEHGVFA